MLFCEIAISKSLFDSHSRWFLKDGFNEVADLKLAKDSFEQLKLFGLTFVMNLKSM